MTTKTSGALGAWPVPQATAEYLLDAWQRTILTWDLLHQRGDQYLEHEKSGNPPVLVFDYQMVVDGRTLRKPANYALVCITPPAECPAADAKKRPFVVVDPRAGHGPGIGGFKIDSEIGIALKFGHPCYFVMFFPQPVAGQTIESVCSAEVEFMRKVNALHPGSDKPFVIGNCQGRRAGARAGRPDPASRLADLGLDGRGRQEPVNPQVPSTIETAALCKMAERGQITGAISLEAAMIRKIDSPVAGRANVLIVPNLEAGNMLAKSLSFLAKADCAGIVLGAKVPIILTSRADSVMSNLASCAVAVLVAKVRHDSVAKAIA